MVWSSRTRRSTAGPIRLSHSGVGAITGDDDAGRSALRCADRGRTRFARAAGDRSGVDRGGNCPTRALWPAAARLFALGAGAGPRRAAAADAAFSAGVTARPLPGLAVS